MFFYNDRLINHSLFIWGKKISFLKRGNLKDVWQHQLILNFIWTFRIKVLFLNITVKLLLTIQQCCRPATSVIRATPQPVMQPRKGNKLLTVHRSRSKFTLYSFVRLHWGSFKSPLEKVATLSPATTPSNSALITMLLSLHILQIPLQFLSQPHPKWFPPIPQSHIPRLLPKSLRRLHSSGCASSWFTLFCMTGWREEKRP